MKPEIFIALVDRELEPENKWGPVSNKKTRFIFLVGPSQPLSSFCLHLETLN